MCRRSTADTRFSTLHGFCPCWDVGRIPRQARGRLYLKSHEVAGLQEMPWRAAGSRLYAQCSKTLDVAVHPSRQHREAEAGGSRGLRPAWATWQEPVSTNKQRQSPEAGKGPAGTQAGPARLPRAPGPDSRQPRSSAPLWQSSWPSHLQELGMQRLKRPPQLKSPALQVAATVGAEGLSLASDA